MNIILFERCEVSADNRVTLNDYRAEHIVKVLGAQVGDILRVGQINGKMGEGRVLTLQKKFPFSAELSVELRREPPQKGAVDIILALPRPIMLKRILGQLAPLGIANLYVIHSRRVEKSFWHANLFDKSEYFPFLLHGLEQAVDTLPPDIHFTRSFRQFVEKKLPEFRDLYSHLLFAHPAKTLPLAACLERPQGKILLAIGPEGGWIDYEIEQFEKAGFAGFSLGERILKVDTALANIHGRISALLERDTFL